MDPSGVCDLLEGCLFLPQLHDQPLGCRVDSAPDQRRKLELLDLPDAFGSLLLVQVRATLLHRPAADSC